MTIRTMKTRGERSSQSLFFLFPFLIRVWKLNNGKRIQTWGRERQWGIEWKGRKWGWKETRIIIQRANSWICLLNLHFFFTKLHLLLFLYNYSCESANPFYYYFPFAFLDRMMRELFMLISCCLFYCHLCIDHLSHHDWNVRQEDLSDASGGDFVFLQNFLLTHSTPDEREVSWMSFLDSDVDSVIIIWMYHFESGWSSSWLRELCVQMIHSDSWSSVFEVNSPRVFKTKIASSPDSTLPSSV